MHEEQHEEQHEERNGGHEPSVGRRGLLRLTGAAAVVTTAAMVLPSARAAAATGAAATTPAGEGQAAEGQGPSGSEVRDRAWRLRTEQLRANGDSLQHSAELTRQSLAGQTALRIPAGPPR
ncbi:hypothetical protein [Nonomuraea sp. NPDC050783]|uniref:hypothetical protein n=1 Tax=Nonomuraea sp. NPDC050783 TaxID=3154634 RepID=UPI003467AF8E